MENFDSSCYARINGNTVRISTNATQCQYCNQFQWSIKNCPKCVGTKVIKHCKNTMMHPNNNSGLFLVSYKNQEYCSTTCQFEEDGAFKVAVNFENATIEADIDPKTLTVYELQYSIIEQTTVSKASPPMIIPARDGLANTEQLAGNWDVEPNETNVDFIKRSSALLSGNEPISTFFKLPCSELTLNQYIEGTATSAAVDIKEEYAKYCMITDEGKLNPKELVYTQLSNKVGTYVNQQGHRMLLLRIVPLKSVHKAGKTPMNAEGQLLRWFEHVGLDKVNISMLKNRKNMYFKAGKQSLVVGSVNGNAYYDKFLREYAYERTDIISPFFSDRAWIVFNFTSEQKRNAWLEHYQKVIDASPPRSFGAVKYLITTELMKNDKDYHKLVNDESDDEEQRWSYYDDMILRYKLLQEHDFKKNDGSIKPPKLPKKKAGKRAINRPTPPSALIEEEEEKSSKRLIFRFSREHLKKRPKFSEDSNSWMDTHDPYAEEEEENI
jgi:hypothetical protein